jgi:hypothetical protein
MGFTILSPALWNRTSPVAIAFVEPIHIARSRGAEDAIVDVDDTSRSAVAGEAVGVVLQLGWGELGEKARAGARVGRGATSLLLGRVPKPDHQYDRAAEDGHEPTSRHAQNPALSDGLSSMKPLSLAQEFRLALLAEHAIRLEHLTLLSSAPA